MFLGSHPTFYIEKTPSLCIILHIVNKTVQSNEIHIREYEVNEKKNLVNHNIVLLLPCLGPLLFLLFLRHQFGGPLLVPGNQSSEVQK